MLLANTQWIDPKTGMPTLPFFSLMKAVWVRTGSGQAPAGNGEIGLTFVSDQSVEAILKAEQALGLGLMAVMGDADAPPVNPKTLPDQGGSSGGISVDVVDPGDAPVPPFAAAKAWFLGG